ncbi:DUF5362 family protein [Paenibacillus yanchengensis]|uniref:DUF5362 family protein n=1 Tax=Paenibacillus yanchengensis TaxID=2035833 RepID=A0ABW4YJ81_9BACL
MLSPFAVDTLRGIQKWGKFVGWFTVVMGVISALFGLLAFVVGAIPGVISIFLGLFLIRSAESAGRLVLEYDTGQMDGLFDNYKKYLKLQGILMIINLVVLIVGLLGYGAVIIALLTGSGL